MKKKLLFIHIPKCGGHSVEASLWHVFGDNNFFRLWQWEQQGKSFADLSKKEVLSYSCLSGHLFFKEVEEKIGLNALKNDYFICAVIRNPIDQVLSLYNYVSEYTEHPEHEIVKRMPLESFEDNFTINQQCAYLGNGQNSDPCGKSTLALIRDIYDLVLPLEHLDIFNRQLESYFDIQIPKTYHQNKTKHRKILAKDLSESTLDYIKARNSEDLFVYNQIMQDLADKGTKKIVA